MRFIWRSGNGPLEPVKHRTGPTSCQYFPSDKQVCLLENSYTWRNHSFTSISNHNTSEYSTMASSAAYKSTLAVHILFGPQLLDFTQHSATHLRSTILERPSLQWLFDALLNLRGDWNSMAQNLPTLSAYCGDQFFAALQHFLRTGDDLEVEHPFPNILLTPLVVATHIVQYCALLELFEPRPSHWDVVQAWFSRNCIVTGLCTGLLTTSAIAAHDTWTDVKTECIMALRAAMLIGAVVDVNDTRLDGNRWTSFVVSSVDAMVEHLESIMTAFDDVSRSTLTRQCLTLSPRLMCLLIMVTGSSL